MKNSKSYTVVYVCPSCGSDDHEVFYDFDGGDDQVHCNGCNYVSGWLGYNEKRIYDYK